MIRTKKNGTSLFKALLLEHRLPSRYIRLGGFWNTVVLRKIRKIYLFLPILLNKYANEDITVVIPVRNRCDYRLVNALKSLREQDYDKKLIKISVIDYGSKKEFIDKYKEICKKFDAEYIRVENTIIWCKAHALNIGIKRANTKYVMSTDVDMILENNYLNEAVKELRRNPYQILISTFFCSSEGDINNKINIKKSYAELKDKANKIDTKTIFGNLNVGINVGLAYFYKKIKGYDERYKLWGYEDNDLIKRFELLGLNVCDISKKSSFIHQWHPSTEKKKDFIFEKHRYTNWNYLLKSSSIIRNKSGWGING